MNDYKSYLDNTSNLIVLYNLKRTGLPKSDEELALLFKKFNVRNNGDYPVSWEHLCIFLPEIENEFGIERYLSIHKKYDLGGPDIKQSINKSEMSELEKEFMLFVYEV